MAYIVDTDSPWQHCGRPAEIEDCTRDLDQCGIENCTRDLDQCGIENCHAVYCNKCGQQLAGFDCEPG